MVTLALTLQCIPDSLFKSLSYFVRIITIATVGMFKWTAGGVAIPCIVHLSVYVHLAIDASIWN